MTPDCTLIIPTPNQTPTVLHLHAHHLAAKSVFLRRILSGETPHFVVRNRPRVLPSPPSHPVIFLPVPDTASIQPLFHWMYSGSTAHLEHALHHGHVQWQGIARNVEYLGLPTDIKVFLGRWYRDWCLPNLPIPVCPPDELFDDSDESDLDSEGDDLFYDGYYSSSEDEDEMQSDDDDDDDDDSRGRSRDIKPLVQLCAQMRLCTT